MDNLDVYHKKTVTYNYRGKNLSFKISQSLFSSYDIDLGTKHLLQTLSSEGFDSYEKVLDLGCGYGPIGISLKSFYKPCVMHMVDRDSLALDFSRQNAKLNGLEEIKFYGSLGYDDVPETEFDLIVSNIPAKVGDPILSHILEDARFHLRPGGRVAVVVIDEIGEYVTKVLKSNKNINILFYKRWPGYLVFHYEFSKDNSLKSRPNISGFEKGIYNRGQKDFTVDDSKITVETFYGLPEFDTLSYETEILLNKMVSLKNKHLGKSVIFNMGQGFIPSALSKLCETDRINLIDRDLEALRASRVNLISNGYDPKRIFLSHCSDFSNVDSESVDLVLGILDDKEDSEVNNSIIRELAKKLSDTGVIILSSGSTPITRIESTVKREKILDVIERQKSKSKSLIILKHKTNIRT